MREIGQADVLVAGGGVTGFAAAVAAARNGADTILIEKNGIPGGVATSALMMSIGNHLCTGDDRLVVRGIAEELIDRVAHAGGTHRVWKSVHHQHITFDVEVMVPVMLEMLREAGVRTLLHTMVCDVVREGRALTGVIAQHASGACLLRGKAFVDATGEATLAIRAGEDYEEKNGRGSLLFVMGNVDLQQLYLFFKEHPGEYPERVDHSSTFEDFERNWLERGVFHLPHGGGKKYSFIQNAVREGRLASSKNNLFAMDVFGFFGLRHNGTCLINSNFVNLDSDDPWDMSEKELEARREIPALAKICKEYIPGFQNAYVSHTAGELGLRATKIVKTQYDFTLDEKAAPTRFDDAIGEGPAIQWVQSDVLAGDLYHTKKYLSGQVKMPYTYQIPYRVILARKTENLLVASGRSIADTVLRQMASCMMLGQASGVAASLAARKGCGAGKVDIGELQAVLRGQNVYLGESNDTGV